MKVFNKFAILLLSLILIIPTISGEYWATNKVFAGSQKINGLGIGDNKYLDFGNDNDLRCTYDEATNNRFEAVMTAGGMYFDVTDYTLYSDDLANDTFTVYMPTNYLASLKYKTLTKTENYSVTDYDVDYFFVGNNTADQTLTFPTAADNIGRVITVIVSTDPGDQNFIIDGEGSETIDGATTKTTTDAAGSNYVLISDGTAWWEITHIGTWS